MAHTTTTAAPMIDELRALLAAAMRVMEDLHSAATPDETQEDCPPIISAEAFARFVNQNAALRYAIHNGGHDLPTAPATAAPAAQEAEPASMPTANDLQGALAAAAIGVNSVIHRIGAGNADGALDVAARVKGAIAQAIAFAREADAGAVPEGWRELAARLMDALAEAQERTNRECPRHVECYPGWVTHARWLRWHAEMFRTGRPIGNGAGQPEVLAALAAAPQAPAAAAPALQEGRAHLTYTLTAESGYEQTGEHHNITPEVFGAMVAVLHGTQPEGGGLGAALKGERHG